jgi:hypothetical protein
LAFPIFGFLFGDFLFEPELNACIGLGLTRNCLFLNPKKRKILKHATHLLDSKISKKSDE